MCGRWVWLYTLFWLYGVEARCQHWVSPLSLFTHCLRQGCSLNQELAPSAGLTGQQTSEILPAPSFSGGQFEREVYRWGLHSSLSHGAENPGPLNSTWGIFFFKGHCQKLSNPAYAQTGYTDKSKKLLKSMLDICIYIISGFVDHVVPCSWGLGGLASMSHTLCVTENDLEQYLPRCAL